MRRPAERRLAERRLAVPKGAAVTGLRRLQGCGYRVGNISLCEPIVRNHEKPLSPPAAVGDFDALAGLGLEAFRGYLSKIDI